MKKQIKHEFTLEKAQSGKYKIVDDIGIEYKFITYIEDADPSFQVTLLNLTSKIPTTCTINGKAWKKNIDPHYHLIEEVETQTYWVGVFITPTGEFWITPAFTDKLKCTYPFENSYTLIHETTFEA